ncbi:MAG: hypothetical protein IJD58_11430 [Lachnospiraceae bacterium]|nr:hypothetical protein [Lachnospiraceae bacterium]
MMNDLRKIAKDADENTLTIALSNIVSGVVIASGLLMSAILVAVSFLWGWIGFISVIGTFIITLLVLAFGRDE